MLFIKKVRKDDLIGPIFNTIIEDWPKHLERLTDFWETNLFGVKRYNGNPISVHIEKGRKTENTVTQLHFGRWLQLWFETIDLHFIRGNANLAKNNARKMSTMLFMKIFQARNQ